MIVNVRLLKMLVELLVCEFFLLVVENDSILFVVNYIWKIEIFYVFKDIFVCSLSYYSFL